jgi:hypothetical protein
MPSHILNQSIPWFILMSPFGDCIRAVVQVVISPLADSELVSPDILLTLETALDEYARDRMSYDHCAGIFRSLKQSESPLCHLARIRSLPETSLPIHPSRSNDRSSRLLLRQRSQPWTTIEDDRLLCAIARFGFENWRSVAAFVGAGRTRSQCSQRWIRGLDPRIQKTTWNPEDESRLCTLVDMYGMKNWAKIASIIGTRSDVQCRYRYLQMQNKKGERTARLMTPSPPSSPSQDGLLLSPKEGDQRAHLEGGTAEVTRFTRVREHHDIALRPPLSTFGICGADPKSMDSFLRCFA